MSREGRTLSALGHHLSHFPDLNGTTWKSCLLMVPNDDGLGPAGVVVAGVNGRDDDDDAVFVAGKATSGN